MKKSKWFLCVLVIIGYLLVQVHPGWTTVISEAEPNDLFATAQSLDGFFSTDLNADIFNSTTVPHVSVEATNGATTDVDYYSFTVVAALVTGYFDIDYGTTGVFVDTTLALFDSGFNTLAADDDSPVDPGSVSGLDSFIGVYTFSAPGTYYAAVSNFANFPLLGTIVGFLTRPDGLDGGVYTLGDSGATAMSTSSGFYSAGDYTLHASLSEVAPVPEPTTMLLLGPGLVGLAGFRRKFRQ